MGGGQVGVTPQTMDGRDGQLGAPVRRSRFGAAVGLQLPLPPQAVWPAVLDHSGCYYCYVQPESHVSMPLAGGQSASPCDSRDSREARGSREFVPAGERRARAARLARLARGSTVRAAWPPGTNHAVGDLDDAGEQVGGLFVIGTTPITWAQLGSADGPTPRKMRASPDSRFPV